MAVVHHHAVHGAANQFEARTVVELHATGHCAAPLTGRQQRAIIDDTQFAAIGGGDGAYVVTVRRPGDGNVIIAHRYPAQATATVVGEINTAAVSAIDPRTLTVQVVDVADTARTRHARGRVGRHPIDTGIGKRMACIVGRSEPGQVAIGVITEAQRTPARQVHAGDPPGRVLIQRRHRVQRIGDGGKGIVIAIIEDVAARLAAGTCRHREQAPQIIVGVIGLHLI